MLYDKRWEKPEVKADPLTFTSLIAWLETKSPNEKYDYMNCEGACLYGLYMTHHGIPWENSGACGVHRYADPSRYDFCQQVYSQVARPWPWTFGAALERARKALG